MARLSKVERQQASSEVREVFENTARLRGNIPNMFRIYAHRPELMKTMVAHLNAITNSGTVPVQTKELVATLVSRVNGCDY